MKATYIEYKDTGSFSKLLISYLEDHPDIRELYGHRPTLEGFRQQLSSKPSFQHSDLLADVLTEQYTGLLEAYPEVKNNIEFLRADNTFTVTTGHQLNLFTGPLYFIFKIVSAIRLAKDLKEEFPEQNFVPVYWMATEDHDFAEINHTYLFGKKVEWDIPASGATGRISTQGIEEAVQQYCSMFGLVGEAQRLTELVHESYLQGYSLAQATRNFVNGLFGTYGLIIVDADHPKLKQVFAEYIYNDLSQKISFYKTIEASQRLEDLGYKAQVHPRELNFFYLEEGVRERMLEEEGIYSALNTELAWTDEELKVAISAHPERFSPNVLMRPLYQELILPNLAYIGGGAEIAYWLQLKSTFDAHGVTFPILIPRNSAMLMDSKMVSKIFRFDFTFKSMFKSSQALHDEYVRRHTKHRLNLKDEWMELSSIFAKIKLRAHKIDPTLEPSTAAVQARLKRAVDNLEKKLLKADKRNYEEVLVQIDQLKEKLFPEGHLQERHENFAFHYLKHGDRLFDELIKHLHPLDFKFSILY